MNRRFNKKSTVYVDYQQRAKEFTVGNMALPLNADASQAGRIVAVYPAIGMIELEFPNGSKRYPVEDVQNIDAGDFWIEGPQNSTVPGGKQTVPVSIGPKNIKGKKQVSEEARKDINTEKRTFQEVNEDRKQKKQALYWRERDRRYNASRQEINTRTYACPKCKEEHLKPCVYKREYGQSEKLYGCPSCLFLIRRSDILNTEGI